MPRLTKRERSIAAKFRRLEKTLEQAKALYDKADGIKIEIARHVEGAALTRMRERLAEAAKSRHSIRIDESGQQLQLRENLADEKGILGWGHGAVRQFDLKVVNP
jgi:hypothetical protein